MNCHSDVSWSVLSLCIFVFPAGLYTCVTEVIKLLTLCIKTLCDILSTQHGGSGEQTSFDYLD